MPLHSALRAPASMSSFTITPSTCWSQPRTDFRRSSDGGEPFGKHYSRRSPKVNWPRNRIRRRTNALRERRSACVQERPDNRPKREIKWLVDRTAGPSTGRVCSRFTVETELFADGDLLPAARRSGADGLCTTGRFWQRIIQMLDATGVRSDSKQHWDVEVVQGNVDEKSNGEGAWGVEPHQHACLLAVGEECPRRIDLPRRLRKKETPSGPRRTDGARRVPGSAERRVRVDELAVLGV